MRVENTVDVVESAERETAPVVEPADDARSVPHRERHRRRLHPGEVLRRQLEAGPPPPVPA
jgi:hypothetical protein